MGIVRVSHVGDRSGEFSPEDQEKRMGRREREVFRIVDVIRELDVSGGTLPERAGCSSVFRDRAEGASTAALSRQGCRQRSGKIGQVPSLS